MSFSLYEIDNMVYTVLENGLIFDEETGEVLFDEENLTALEMARNEKLEAVALYIKSLEAEAEAMKAEAKKLLDRREAKERKAERLRSYISNSMQALGDTKLETAKVALSFRKSESVDVYEPALLPAEYTKTKTTVTPDKTAIKAAIKAGQEVAGATLEIKQNLQIK